MFGPHSQVEKLDEQGKRHREIDVAFLDVHAGRFGCQHHADQDQEAQREDLQRGIFVDEPADRIGAEEHHADGENDRDHHHRQVVGHPHGGNHRVERKDDIEQGDLKDHAAETDRCLFILVAGFPFQRIVHLVNALADQEQPTGKQDQVLDAENVVFRQPALREAPFRECQQRAAEETVLTGIDHREQQDQQQQPGEQRGGQAQPAGESLLVCRQSAAENGDEDHVVDAQHDFHAGQCHQRQKPLHDSLSRMPPPGRFVPRRLNRYDSLCRPSRATLSLA